MLSRRALLSQAAFASVAAKPFLALAQSGWPVKPVKLVVPYSAGGGIDQTARFYADQLRDRWGHSVVVDNKPGAGTIIGAQAALGSASDGHTLFVTTPTTFVLPFISSAPFNPLEAFVPIAELRTDQLVLVMHPTEGVSTLAEALEAARRSPDEFAFGSYGPGTIPHLLLEEINKSRELRLPHIPYKGTAPLTLAVVSGEVRFAITDYGVVKSFIETGKLKLLGVTGARRSPFLPQVPTLLESRLSTFDWPSWIGLFAPRSFPPPVIERIARDVREIAATKGAAEKFASNNAVPGNLVLTEFAKQVARDGEQYGKRNVEAGVRLGN